jgi:hypothetical protein
MNETTNCAKCKTTIDVLDAFPGRICLACHAAKFDQQVKNNGGVLPRPDFSKAFRT